VLSEYETEFFESNRQMNKENREPAAKRAKINKQTQPAATMNSEENMVRFYIFLYVKHNNSVTGSFVRENFIYIY
jgi:hypothetical protein